MLDQPSQNPDNFLDSHFLNLFFHLPLICARPMVRSHWRDHSYSTRHNLHIYGRLAYDLAIRLNRQWLLSIDYDALHPTQEAYMGILSWSSQQDAPYHPKVAKSVTSAHNAHVKLTIVHTNLRSPTKGRISEAAAVGDRDLRCPKSPAPPIDQEGEAAWPENTELCESRPKVGHEAEPAFILAPGVAHHQRADADADAQEAEPIANLHCVYTHHRVLTRQQAQCAFEIQWDAQIARERVSCTDWGDPQRDPRMHKPINDA
jgi:hypothetical protein